MSYRFPEDFSVPLGLAYNLPRLVLVTAPAVEPWLVSDTEVQKHLELDDSSGDDYVTALLKAARTTIERQTGRSLIETVWRAEWDHLPRAGTYAGAATVRELVLPRAPLVSVSAITYLDTAGATQTFASGSYTVGPLDPARPGRLWLDDDAIWPDLGSFPGALRCTFTAGYGAAATAIPADLRLAVLWLTAWWYEERQPVSVGNITSELPHHLASIVDAYRAESIA